eukprot:scaffold12116_cov125-Cylindrotheca_fusiformis.AAC.3
MNASSAVPSVARSSMIGAGSTVHTPLRSFTHGGSHLVSPLLRAPLGRLQEDEDLSKSLKENLPNHVQAPQGPSLLKQYDKKANRDQLKAILHQNGQQVTGTVKVLQDRVADGEARGKLGICPQCTGGKLKVSDKNPHVVLCSRKLACGFQCSAETAPRSGPWIGGVSFDEDEIQPAGPAATITPKRTSEATAEPQQRPAKKKRITNVLSPMEQQQQQQQKVIPQPNYTAQNNSPDAHPYALNYPGTPQQAYYHQYPQYHAVPYPYYQQNDGSPSNDPPGFSPMYGNGYASCPPPPSPYNNMMMYNYHPPYSPPPPPSPRPTNPSTPREFPHDAREGQRIWPAVTQSASFQNPEQNGAAPPREHHSPSQVQMATRAAQVALESQRGSDKKQQWTPEEDAIVMRAVNICSSPFKGWSCLMPHLPGRTGKQIRDRWVNHLNPALVHSAFSREDDLLLWKGFLELGKSWKEISVRFFRSSRSENRIKNRWYSGTFKNNIVEMIGHEAYTEAVEKANNTESLEKAPSIDI